MPMDFNTMLSEIEKRPELYVGNGGITALRHYLCGYICAKEEHIPDYSNNFFSEFNAHLARKYNDTRSVDWACLIQTHEPDGDSTQAFFRLYHEFYSHSKIK